MEKLRRSMMFVPGNNPSMVKEANIYHSDSIMFDLEDSVSLPEKDSARNLIFSALTSLDFSAIETVVRINALDEGGIEDIYSMVCANVDVIRLPKTESADDILAVEKHVEVAEKRFNKQLGSTKLMAAIEDAKGVLNAPSIATSSERLIGIALGAEDYVTNLKTDRYPDGQELFFARSMILHAARAANIAAIDTVYSDVDNIEEFTNEVKLIKQLGFDGKSVINPKQISIIHDIYYPSDKEILHAEMVIAAIQRANEQKSGVISLNGKMIDKPIVERAKRVLSLANKENSYEL